MPLNIIFNIKRITRNLKALGYHAECRCSRIVAMVMNNMADGCTDN